MSAEWEEPTRRLPNLRMTPPWQPPVVPEPENSPSPQPSPRHADSPGSFFTPAGDLPPRSGPPEDEPDGEDYDDLVIRPFLLTGGRTRPTQDGLRVESLLQVRPGVRLGSLRFEHRQIVELCQKATSVAELAAALRVPLGVAKVLVSDLVADGSLTLVEREELSVQMIERIRDRVRAL